MRKLETIQTKENLNEVYAADEKGKGNANHIYMIKGCDGIDKIIPHAIYFQNGARKDDNATHGITDQDLLEIVRDRMKGFQSGDFACEYNKKALEHIEQALYWLNKRVEDRIERGVLGTYEK